MSLDLNPDVERELVRRATAAGTTASDYVARLLQAAPAPPSDPVSQVRALLAQWQRADQTPIAAPPPNDGTMTPSEALFRRWEQEDAGLTEEEYQAAESLWQGFQRGIDAERNAAGMRSLF